MQFSQRTEWHRRSNPLAALLEERRKSGKPVYDLTVSNPTDCGISYPQRDLVTSLSDPRALRYHPDPRGLLSARETISRYYLSKKVDVEPSRIFLTASTSEGFSVLFTLLCNPGEEVLVPQPSYPLFDYLAQLHDVKLRSYRLIYDHEWSIDVDSIRKCITPSTRALVLVNPHNPTGMFLNQAAYRLIKEIAAEHSIALIVDEVFVDFPIVPGQTAISTATERDVLSFTLNGISKMAGLPQMKLGWIVVGGDEPAAVEAAERLEIILDTYLSVNTPVQVALPGLLKGAEIIRENILARIRMNYAHLREAVTSQSSCSVLNSEGGWSGIIRVPNIKSDERWALDLLEKKGIYLHPGYFFDFETEGHLVVSLLVLGEVLQSGVRGLVEYADREQL